MVFIEGVLPGRIEIAEPEWKRIPRFLDKGRFEHTRNQGLSQNHSSRDRGLQLQVNPTARSRRGNRR